MGVSFTDNQNEKQKTASDKSDVPEENGEHGECLRILNLVLDDEASDHQKAYFKEHIKNCMPYYEIYNLSKTIKTLIKNKCNDKQVPTGLVDSIKHKISENYKQ